MQKQQLWIKKYLFDETAFLRMMRGITLGLGALVATGEVDLPGWVAAAALFLGGSLGAGDKNPEE